MLILKSFCSAFSMYSRIPVPRVKWCEENRRYALCFFPLIGAVIGGAMLLWYYLCGVLGLNSLLFAAVATVLPIIITGGIHLDGFCDVNDAKASCAPREKMLAIMSDSHIGAFAAISLAVCLLLQLGVYSQLDSFALMLICALSFVQSRAWSGLAAVTFKSAKSEGALCNFSKPAHKTATITMEIVYLVLSSAAMVMSSPICGAAGILGGAAVFLYYRVFSYKRFGGTTGDLAGYFTVLCEPAITFAAVIAGAIAEVIL